MKEILGVKLYSLTETGQLLGVQPQTLSKYITDKKLKTQTIGGAKYVTEENLKAFLNNIQ